MSYYKNEYEYEAVQKQVHSLHEFLLFYFD